MAAHNSDGAAAPGASTPTSDEAPAGGTAQGFRIGNRDESDSLARSHSPHALRVIEGERKAGEFLARLHSQRAEPDELARIVAALYGAALRGFCAVITKALRAGGAR